jgi:Inner membrane protein YgaP-like, transmembrane domain
MKPVTTIYRTNFGSSFFAQFMAGNPGRLTRIVAGIALIAIGPTLVGGTVGWIVAAVGLVPLLAGAFDVCIFSALFGGPFTGTAIRACKAS